MQCVPCFPPFLQTPVRLAFIGTWKPRAMQGSRRSTLKLRPAQKGEKAGEMCAATVATQRTTAPWRVRHCLCAVRCVMRGERDARETRIDREGGRFGTCTGRRLLTKQQKSTAHTHSLSLNAHLHNHVDLRAGERIEEDAGRGRKQLREPRASAHKPEGDGHRRGGGHWWLVVIKSTQADHPSPP